MLKPFKTLVILLITLLFAEYSFAQLPGSARQKFISTKVDTAIIDTLSLVPASVTLYLPTGELLSDSLSYTINEAASTIIFRKPRAVDFPDSLKVVFRVFPLLFTKTYKNRDRDVIEKTYSGLYNPFTYENNNSENNIFKMEGLQRNGNISRGVTFGNNQDLVVNSSFNLQLAGKVSEDVEILAAITDNNIPVQPEGNTQQIQDFDKVFIQLSKNKTKLLAGDFELRRPDSYFMNFYKKGQGGVLSSEYTPFDKKDQEMRTTVSGAISKGKYSRNVFDGIEANQGPYRLTGSENESFIVVLAGTEKVFIDGVEMQRGEQSDYIIDYNTAEIRFTTKRPITKDKRIVVEFQYSDKNYSRTLYYINQEYEDKKWKVKANIFSEQDAKNQPLLQDLNEEQKLLLALAGDSIQQAYSPNIDSVAFNSDEVLYAKIDSGGYVFYRYSTDSTIAFFRLGFSNVGQGKGNYTPVSSGANGRVFQWIEPVAGIPQGAYEPVTLLISPKKQQLYTLGADYKISTNSKAFVETAYSKNDINLFSKKDKANDNGYAFAGGFENAINLSNDTVSGWKLKSAVRLEHVNEQFKPLETYRGVEFNRDWNLANLNATGNENIGGIMMQVSKPNQLASYQFKTFIKGSDYKGFMNLLNVRLTWQKFNLLSNGSFLISNSKINDTKFVRSSTDLSRSVWKIILGGRYDQERNQILDAQSDSLSLSSFSYDAGKFYITSNDTSKIRFRFDVSRRYDYGVRSNNYKRSTAADEASGKIEFTKNANSKLTLSGNYRKLTISDSLLSKLPDEESVLFRAEYNANIWKGLISLTTYYEAGTGQELKRDYAYLEVAPGTGVYTYGGDYNNNGVKDLDEFEIAAFADQANYVKIYLPTNEYIKTRTNVFNQVVTISPSAYFQKQEGWQKFVGRFNNQTSYRIDNKTLEQDLLKAMNPFYGNVNSDALLATNSAFRNTLSFNRNNTVFGTDVTYLDNRNKAILTNGFETRQFNNLVNNVRWNITRVYSILVSNENGTKISKAEYFSNRDYKIKFYSVEPKFSVQPSVTFRTTLTYKYNMKENVIGDVGEKSKQHNVGVECKYSPVNKGIFTVKFNLIKIDYNAPENNSIAYEMLEGLKVGRNYTWGATMQRNLSNSIQVNINYEGRKPTGIKTIHTGTVQARAFF